MPLVSVRGKINYWKLITNIRAGRNNDNKYMIWSNNMTNNAKEAMQACQTVSVMETALPQFFKVVCSHIKMEKVPKCEHTQDHLQK